MRGLLAFLLAALLAINLVTFWQIQHLQAQVGALELKLQKAETKRSAVDTLLATSFPLLYAAKEALQNADLVKARDLAQQTLTSANQAGHALGDKAAPALSWLKQQAQNVQKQIDSAHK